MASKIYVITWKEFEDGCMSVETPTKAAAFAKEADADHCFVQCAPSKGVCGDSRETYL